MFARWFRVVRPYCAFVGTAVLLAIAGSFVLILLALMLGLSSSFSTFIWLSVFLLPTGSVFGAILLARVRVINRHHALTRLFVGYVGYILIMLLVFAIGLYSRPDVWIPVIILALLSLSLFAPVIKTKGTQFLYTIKQGAARFYNKNGSSVQRSLFSEHEAFYSMNTSKYNNKKQQ